MADFKKYMVSCPDCHGLGHQDVYLFENDGSSIKDIGTDACTLCHGMGVLTVEQYELFQSVLRRKISHGNETGKH